MNAVPVVRCFQGEREEKDIENLFHAENCFCDLQPHERSVVVANNAGWNYEHDKGCKEVNRSFPNLIEVWYKVNSKARDCIYNHAKHDENNEYISLTDYLFQLRLVE